MQGQQGAQQVAEQLSNPELAAVSAICALGLFLALAFVAYAIRNLRELAGTGLFTVVGQITFSIIVIYVIALLMLKGTIDSDAGLPILAGLAGVIVGKARGGTTPSDGDGGGGREESLSRRPPPSALD